MGANANHIPEIALNDGAMIPQLGFGVWRVPLEHTAGVYVDLYLIHRRIAESALNRDARTGPNPDDF